MGGELLRRGWVGPTDDANLRDPEKVQAIHRAFVAAGAEIVLTNTFMAAHGPVATIPDRIGLGIELATGVAGGAFVVGSLGPRRDWPAEIAVACARAFAQGAVDALWLETLPGPALSKSDIGLLGVLREEFNGPVLVSFVPTLFATERFWEIPTFANGVAISAAGFNCGAGPAETLAAMKRLGGARDTLPPLTARPSAGIPAGAGRALSWPVPPSEFADFAEAASAAGARIVGGCCGASPAHIAAMAERLRSTPKS